MIEQASAYGASKSLQREHTKLDSFLIPRTRWGMKSAVIVFANVFENSRIRGFCRVRQFSAKFWDTSYHLPMLFSSGFEMIGKIGMKRGWIAAWTMVAVCCLRASASAPIVIHDVGHGKSPAIAADGTGKLYAVFEEAKSDKAASIFFTMSNDKGVSWSPPANVSNSQGQCSHPDIAVERGGAIDVVFTDTASGTKQTDIFFVRSNDNGQTWSEKTNIAHALEDSKEPVIAVGDGNNIHIAWSATSKGKQNPDIFFSTSSDGGHSWSPAPVNISNTPGVSNQPTITSTDGIVHVAWLDSTPGPTHPDVYYTRYSQGSWSHPSDISGSPRISSYPGIACGKGKVYLCWSDNSRKECAPDIWCDVASSHGKFNRPINISNTPGVSSTPAIAANDAAGLALSGQTQLRDRSRPISSGAYRWIVVMTFPTYLIFRRDSSCDPSRCHELRRPTGCHLAVIKSGRRRRANVAYADDEYWRNSYRTSHNG